MSETIDHDEIRKWASSHKGKPQKIEAPDVPDRPGLRIDFPEKNDEGLLSENKRGADISWEEFFGIFEEQKLIFIIYPAAAGGNMSFAYRFGKRNRETEISL